MFRDSPQHSILRGLGTPLTGTPLTDPASPGHPPDQPLIWASGRLRRPGTPLTEHTPDEISARRHPPDRPHDRGDEDAMGLRVAHALAASGDG